MDVTHTLKRPLGALLLILAVVVVGSPREAAAEVPIVPSFRIGAGSARFEDNNLEWRKGVTLSAGAHLWLPTGFFSIGLLPEIGYSYRGDADGNENAFIAGLGVGFSFPGGEPGEVLTLQVIESAVLGGGGTVGLRSALRLAALGVGVEVAHERLDLGGAEIDGVRVEFSLDAAALMHTIWLVGQNIFM